MIDIATGFLAFTGLFLYGKRLIPGCVAGIVIILCKNHQHQYGDWSHFQVATLNGKHGAEMHLSGCLS